MDFYAVFDQFVVLLQQRGRASYRALQMQFHLDDDQFAALKEELVEVQQLAVEQDSRMLVWTGDAGPAPVATATAVVPRTRRPSPTPPPIWRRRSSPPQSWKASASRSRCSLPI